MVGVGRVGEVIQLARVLYPGGGVHHVPLKHKRVAVEYVYRRRINRAAAAGALVFQRWYHVDREHVTDALVPRLIEHQAEGSLGRVLAHEDDRMVK